MKILFVDRDPLMAGLAAGHLEPVGHRIVHESAKTALVPAAKDGSFDVFCIDPSPLNEARNLVMSVRHNSYNYPYMLLVGDAATQEQALGSGFNDALPRPLDVKKLDEKIKNAAFFLKTVRRLGDTQEDFPSAGGIISKSAFNQLFLSAIDRALRYGEVNYVLFIGLENYADIGHNEGMYTADYAAAKLSQFLVRVRRQTDIIAQVGRGEFALLLQRPASESEPMEAAARFVQAISDNRELFGLAFTAPRIGVRLANLPIGVLLFEQVLGTGTPS